MNFYKIILINFIFCNFLLLNSANANTFGLGVILSSPTGLSGKYYLSKKNAIDGSMAWKMGSDSSLYLHSTYLWEKPNHINIDADLLNLQYGVGGYYYNHKKNNENINEIGIRLPVGVSYFFKKTSIEVFAEIALNMTIIESSALSMTLGLGGRFYF